MKDKFEISLLESGELLKRGASAIINNVGRTVAAITLVIATLVLFTDISFANFSAESFTSTMAIMLMASYLMYFSLEDSGEKLGEESDEYKKSKLACDALIDSIGGEKIHLLRKFCKEYSEEEAKYRRANLLLSRGYSTEDYESYKNGDCTSAAARRVFKRADRLKAKTLTPKDLLTKERAGTKSELQNPETAKLLRMIVKLLPTTVCTAVTVSVMLTTKDNLSLATVIDGLFKLSALLIIGFKGYASGYSYTKYTLPVWIDTKTRLLDAFIKSCATG